MQKPLVLPFTMIKRIAYNARLVAIFVAIVSAISCGREEPLVNGRISISFSTSDLATKVGDGVVSDGGGIAFDAGKPNIVVALANRAGDIVAWYPSDFPDTQPSGYTSELVSGASATVSTVYISGLVRGTYTAYAVANYTGLHSDALDALKAATTLSDLESIELEVEGTPAVPTFYNTRMPISAKGDLSVNISGNGQVDLDLLRPVAKVEMYFIDQTDGVDPDTGDPVPLTLYNCSVTVHKMNPTKGYLFPTSPDAGTGSLNNLEFSGDELELSSNPTTPSITGKLVFPSTAPEQTLGNRYYCDISFRVAKTGKTYNSGDSTTYTEYEYTDLPVHDYRSADLQFLRRNQLLKINTRITKRDSEHDVSFWYEVENWTSRTGTVQFD